MLFLFFQKNNETYFFQVFLQLKFLFYSLSKEINLHFDLTDFSCGYQS